MQFMVRYLPGLIFFFHPLGIWGQSASLELYWNMQTASPAYPTGFNLQAGDLLQENNFGNTSFLSNQVPSSGYAGASGDNNASLAARAGPLQKEAQGSAYVEFTIIPLPGYRVTINGFSLGMRSTLTGPQQWSLFHSEDEFLVAVAAGSVENNSSWKHVEVSGLQFSAAKPITLRLYGYGGLGTPAINVANWRLDDLLFNTTVVPDNLPVTWRYQRAILLPGLVQLQWGTAFETNHAGFAIERSTDGKTFTLLSFKNSDTAETTIESERDYTYTDSNPLQGMSFYRIVQQDIDGMKHPGKIISVARESTDLSILLSGLNYNRNAGILQLIWHQQTPCLIEIYDCLGRFVKSTRVTGVSTVLNWLVGPLTPGIYGLVAVDLRSGKKVVGKTILISH